MKILFLGDYSSVHAYLAKELRRRGHKVTLVSNGGRYQSFPTDIFLDRKPGLINSFAYLYRIFSLMSEFKGYDVVQLINPNFFSLRPGKLSYFFKQLKKENGSVFLSLAGNDHYFVKACCEGKMFRFSEFRTGSEKSELVKLDPEKEYGWLGLDMKDYTEELYSNLDGAMSLLPEYHFPVQDILGDRLAYTGLPIDLEQLPYEPLEIDGPLKLFIGIRKGMEIQKGTALLLKMARELSAGHKNKCELMEVSDLSLQDYLHAMKESHIVLDQLYSYSPAMNALDAMALGRVAASGAQPEFYDFIGEKELRPVINLNPLRDDIADELTSYINDPSPLFKMSRDGRRLVEKHNDVRIVAKKFEDHWTERLNRK